MKLNVLWIRASFLCWLLGIVRHYNPLWNTSLLTCDIFCKNSLGILIVINGASQGGDFGSSVMFLLRALLKEAS